MKRICLILLAGTLAVWNASAGTASNSQASGSAKGATSLSAGKPGLKVQSDTSAQASQGAQTPPPSRGAGAQASGSASGSNSTSASAQAGQNSANVSSGTTADAVLTSAVDARHNKVGDQVAARTTKDVTSNGQVVIPKGSKLVGHVTQAQAKGEGQAQSSLGIVFDSAIPKHGPEMPVHFVNQALAAGQSTASAMANEGDLMGSAGGMGSASGIGSAQGSRSGGGLVGGATSAVGATAGTATNAAGAATGVAGTATGTAGQAVGATANTAASATGAVSGAHGAASGILSSTSTGVIGLKGLSLTSDASNSSQGSLIVSSTRNVHLDSGTQLLLRSSAEGQAQGSGQMSNPNPPPKQKP
jgi:hypothetical protein